MCTKMDQNDNVLFLKELPEFKKKDIKHKRVTYIRITKPQLWGERTQEKLEKIILETKTKLEEMQEQISTTKSHPLPLYIH